MLSPSDQIWLARHQATKNLRIERDVVRGYLEDARRAAEPGSALERELTWILTGKGPAIVPVVASDDAHRIRSFLAAQTYPPKPTPPPNLVVTDGRARASYADEVDGCTETAARSVDVLGLALRYAAIIFAAAVAWKLFDLLVGGAS